MFIRLGHSDQWFEIFFEGNFEVPNILKVGVPP